MTVEGGSMGCVVSAIKCHNYANIHPALLSALHPFNCLSVVLRVPSMKDSELYTGRVVMNGEWVTEVSVLGGSC